MSNSQGCRKVTERLTASPHRLILRCKRRAASHLFLLSWNKVLVKSTQKEKMLQNTSFLSQKKKKKRRGHFSVKSSSNFNNSSTSLPPPGASQPGRGLPSKTPRGGGARAGAPGDAAASGRASRPLSPGGGDTPRPGPPAPAGGRGGWRSAARPPPPAFVSFRPAPAPASPSDARPAGRTAAAPAEAARPSCRQKAKPTAPGAGPRLPPRAAHPLPPLLGCGEAAAGAAHLPAGRVGRRWAAGRCRCRGSAVVVFPPLLPPGRTAAHRLTGVHGCPAAGGGR